MSGIYLRSNTLILWLSLSAALAASALGAGCSSSSDSGGEAGSGKSSGGATAKAGSGSSEAGDPAIGGETGEGGSEETPDPGTAGKAATGAGGKAATGVGGKAGTAGSTASAGGSTAAGGAGSGEAGERGEVGAGGSPEVEEDPLVVAAQARALALIKSLPANKTCTRCHDAKYQGIGFYPNITPDVATGIGSWNEEQIKTAIRDGKDKDQQTLCATMERYPFNDDQLSDIAIFLKHLPPVNKKITAKCPGSP